MAHPDAVIPDWMTEQKNYSPRADRNGFLAKTILGLAGLFRIFSMKKNESISTARAGFTAILVLGLIILSALSESMFFCGTILAGLLLYLCLSRIEVVKKVLATALASSILTVLIMLPAFFLYGSNSIFTIPMKVFLSVGILSLYSATTPWNRITGARGFFHLPSFVIFILELTLHYILILGNISHDMLIALKLRSVGKDNDKGKSFSGILGTVFLKSLSITEETQQAMECRLFDGTYSCRKSRIHVRDLIPIPVLMVYILLYIITGC